MKLAGKTDVGRVRQYNQDDYRAGELPGDAAWALVCDGMGGARGGREASQCACSVIERCFQEQYSQCIPGFPACTSIWSMLMGRIRNGSCSRQLFSM